LVVEDDEAIMMGLQENLKFSGYDVVTASDGPAALKAGADRTVDLIILDLMLPGLSGYEVCRQLRGQGIQTPVIMLTARQDEFDKLHGFEVGADDYVTKPFSIAELLARAKAVLNRAKPAATAVRRHEFGAFVLDLETRQLTREGTPIPVTRTEFDLLAYFCEHEGKALSRETVMNDVWGLQYFGTQRSLDSFVATLRAKIEDKPSKPDHILTVHGVGYRFLRNPGGK
jgi:DNA-binding response OmpR family regulator